MQWSSQDDGILIVDATGLVTPVQGGAAVIVVARGTLRAIGSVQVLPPD